MKPKTCVAFVLLMLFTLNQNIAIAGNNLDFGRTPARNVGEFVNSDGSVDIEAVRQSGYQGSLDLDGVDVVFDPVTGEPIFCRYSCG